MGARQLQILMYPRCLATKRFSLSLVQQDRGLYLVLVHALLVFMLLNLQLRATKLCYSDSGNIIGWLVFPDNLVALRGTESRTGVGMNHPRTKTFLKHMLITVPQWLFNQHPDWRQFEPAIRQSIEKPWHLKRQWVLAGRIWIAGWDHYGLQTG